VLLNFPVSNGVAIRVAGFDENKTSKNLEPQMNADERK
jgi:hypothetical protein